MLAQEDKPGAVVQREGSEDPCRPAVCLQGTGRGSQTGRIRRQ